MTAMWFSALVAAGLALPAHAAPNAETAPKVSGKYASIVIDADSLEIIHARKIDELRYPASLTKVMTLYLTFDALDAGTITLKSKLKISKKAERVSPTKLGLKAGQTITVEDAIQGLTVKSANDAAIVLAENLAPSVQEFATLMTAKAKTLGMQKTHFTNPHGLPDKRQYTTARDLGKLTVAIFNNHRRYYHYFGQKKFKYKKRTYKNTNGLLHWLVGVDGLKTGFTNASGYNLIVSAQRDDRRIIAVVLGGVTGNSRNSHMQKLIERGFDTIGVKPVKSIPPVEITKKPKTTKDTDEKAVTQIIRLRGRDNQPLTVIKGDKNLKPASWQSESSWSIQVGTFEDKKLAQAQIDDIATLITKKAKPSIVTFTRNDEDFYRARFTQLNFELAHQSCKALSTLKTGCRVIAPVG